MYRHIIDRSNLDEIVCVGADENGKFTRKLTRLQDLESKFIPRRDIVLFNGRKNQPDLYLEVTETGFSGDLVILDMLSTEEVVRVQTIAQKMRDNAKKFPVAKKLLV